MTFNGQSYSDLQFICDGFARIFNSIYDEPDPDRAELNININASSDLHLNKIVEMRSERLSVKIKDFVSHNLIKCPLFFLVFINDIISKFKSVRVWQYADDMKIALRIKDINDCFKIQCDLKELENWCLENKLYLNIGKCKVFCAYRISLPISFDYVLESEILEKVTEINDL